MYNVCKFTDVYSTNVYSTVYTSPNFKLYHSTDGTLWFLKYAFGSSLVYIQWVSQCASDDLESCSAAWSDYWLPITGVWFPLIATLRFNGSIGSVIACSCDIGSNYSIKALHEEHISSQLLCRTKYCVLTKIGISLPSRLHTIKLSRLRFYSLNVKYGVFPIGQC